MQRRLRQHVRMLRALSVLFVCLLVNAVTCQGSAVDYQRAVDSLAKWSRLGEAFNPDVHWVPGGLWYATGRGDSREFVFVARDGAMRRGRDAKQIGIDQKSKRLDPSKSWSASGNSRRASTLTFENRLKRKIRLFWVDRRSNVRAYGDIAPGKKLTQ